MTYADAFATPVIVITCIFPAGIQTVSVSRDYVDKHHETTTSEHKTLNQSCFNVVTTSVTLAQHYSNIGSTSPVCWLLCSFEVYYNLHKKSIFYS